jgi:hypothetical protein
MAATRTLRQVLRDTKLLWEMGLGAVLALLLVFAALHLAWIVVHITETPLIILILATCYGFYLIRHFFRLAYGMVEILIGLVAIFGAMGRAPQVVDDPATDPLLLVQLAAGMYIIIRGFDNFAQAEPFAGGNVAFRGLWELIRARWRRKPDR